MISFELVLHGLTLLISLIVFSIFLMYIPSFVPGEAKRIFVLLTIFVGIYFLSHLFIDLVEITQFFGLGSTTESEEMPVIIGHILQLIGAGFLFYVSVLFRNFTKKLEKARKA